MNAIKILSKVESLCKKCCVTIFICKDKSQDNEGRTAFFNKGEIHIFTQDKSDNWVAVHALHEFCHYLQEAKFIYDNTLPLTYTKYEKNVYLVELEVEYLTYKWLRGWNADEDTLKECRQLILDNLANYV